MTLLRRTLFLWTLILSACSPVIPASQAVSQTDLPTMPATSVSNATTQEIPALKTPPIPKIAETLQTPHIDQPPGGAASSPVTNPQDCGYQWAYQDLPGLSRNFLQSIQTLQPGTQARAFGFGENCIHADGSATFLPMETDFNVTIQAIDLADEAALGEWIVKVMQIIEDIPSEQIIGPRPGRVTIEFEANDENKVISFYIDQYRGLPEGLSFQQIFQALQTPQ